MLSFQIEFDTLLLIASEISFIIYIVKERKVSERFVCKTACLSYDLSCKTAASAFANSVFNFRRKAATKLFNLKKKMQKTQ